MGLLTGKFDLDERESLWGTTPTIGPVISSTPVTAVPTTISREELKSVVREVLAEERPATTPAVFQQKEMITTKELIEKIGKALEPVAEKVKEKIKKAKEEKARKQKEQLEEVVAPEVVIKV